VSFVAAVGTLQLEPARERPDLLAEPVRRAVNAWPGSPASVLVAGIDPTLADTADLVASYGVALSACANCVVVAGRRGGDERVAACVVPATTRADVNGVVKRALDVRKASFLPVERAVAESGMEFGGITPLGLPVPWRVLVDAAVLGLPAAVVGSGLRRSKVVLPGTLLAELPGVEVVDGLGRAGAD
jgi:prolyl-tRNA editing enzyme YbaK/EbsC (Cys-tRNA(Pro) deacylase)